MYNNFDDNNQNNAQKRTSSVNSSLQEIYNQFMPQDLNNNTKAQEDYIVDPKTLNQPSFNNRQNHTEDSFILDPLEAPQGLNITDFEKNFDFSDFTVSSKEEDNIKPEYEIQNQSYNDIHNQKMNESFEINDSFLNSQNTFTAPAIQQQLASLDEKIRQINNQQGIPSASINASIQQPRIEDSLKRPNPFKQTLAENDLSLHRDKASQNTVNKVNQSILNNATNVANAVTATPMQSLDINQFNNTNTNDESDPNAAILNDARVRQDLIDNIDTSTLTKEQKEYYLNHEEDPDAFVDEEYIKRRKVKAKLLQEVAKEASLDKTFGKKEEIYNQIQQERSKIESQDLNEDVVSLSNQKKENKKEEDNIKKIKRPKPELSLSYLFSQFKGAFIEYTAINAFRSNKTYNYKVPYAASMGFIHLFFSFFIVAIASFLFIYTNKEITAISLFTLSLFLIGTSAFKGISSIFATMTHNKSQEYIAPLVTFIFAVIFIYAYQSLQTNNSAFELIITYILSLFVSSQMASTLAFNGYVDEYSNYSRMSLLGIVLSAIICIGLTFLLLNPIVASSVIGVTLFFRTLIDLILQKYEIEIDKEKVMACMLILFVVITLDIAFFAMKVEFLSNFTINVVRLFNINNLYPNLFMLRM